MEIINGQLIEKSVGVYLSNSGKPLVLQRNLRRGNPEPSVVPQYVGTVKV